MIAISAGAAAFGPAPRAGGNQIRANRKYLFLLFLIHYDRAAAAAVSIPVAHTH